MEWVATNNLMFNATGAAPAASWSAGERIIDSWAEKPRHLVQTLIDDKLGEIPSAASCCVLGACKHIL